MMVMMTGGNDVALVPMNKCWQHIFLNVKWPDQLNFNLNGGGFEWQWILQGKTRFSGGTPQHHQTTTLSLQESQVAVWQPFMDLRSVRGKIICIDTLTDQQRPPDNISHMFRTKFYSNFLWLTLACKFKPLDPPCYV